ncbi:hypothetical protein QTP70_002930 [Hemibagrus guttatus]|uniref:Reverse transcriptase domain-containing protein n=1 Tax=Hemibagrus guttatus TaxID=175788 RepID=A0AAE0Q9Z7_9TELE|nr:hypothetical protein QTP70_002930 [Hemibagrus guttatus]
MGAVSSTEKWKWSNAPHGNRRGASPGEKKTQKISGRKSPPLTRDGGGVLHGETEVEQRLPQEQMRSGCRKKREKKNKKIQAGKSPPLTRDAGGVFYGETEVERRPPREQTRSGISRRSQGLEGVWFGDHRISSLIFADDVVLLAPSSLDLQHALGHFAAECEAAGMRVSTSKSEAMVLDLKKVACALQVGGEVLPQVEEFKYLGVLFMSEGRMDREFDRRIGAAAIVMRSMYQSVVVKKELSQKAKLSIYQSIYVPTLTYGHELWVMTERVRSRIQAAEMSFLCRVAGPSFRDRVRSSVTREELGVEPLLLHIERGQLRWLGHLFRMPPGRLPGEVFREEAPGKPQDTLERLCVSAGLGTPRGPSGRAEGSVWGEGVLGDFNLPSDKLHSSGLLALLNSFSLSFNSCPTTHKEGNVLDLVFTHPSPATDMTVTPLHISDHHLVSFSITLPVLPKRNSQHLSLTRRNLHSISPSSVASACSTLPVDFASFYTEKIERICQTFMSLPTSPTSHNQHSATPSLTQLSTVAAEEVLQITRSCNPTTCPLDPIPSAMLQTISPDLLPFITKVINGSLTSGHIPTAFKKARVIPTLKKPALDSSDISNYRPVSLLSFLSKILERVVCNQLSDYLMQNNLHDPNQSGFKAAHSTETALLAVTEKLHAARSAKLSSVLILLDLSVAFDTVNHKTLLSTFRSFGNLWNSRGMVCFLPGWSLISDTTTSARISACLADISSWMTAHQLKLNPSKTELLIIPGDPSPAQDLAISLSNSMISPSASARNLGVTMDNQLSFSSHVTHVTCSCRFLLYNIRRIWPFLSTQATQVLVQSLVISRLDYCNSLLAGLPLNAIRPLQMIQNAAARLVFNLPKFSHTTQLLRSLHWLPVAARIRFKTLMLAYKAKNGPAPSYLKALVTSRTAPRLLRSTSTARLVPPSLREKENLNIFSSATSSSDSCLFLSDTVSKPYSMAGLTTVLYTIPLILADIF